MRDTALCYARLSLQGEDESSIERQVTNATTEASRRKLKAEVISESAGHRSGRSEKSRPAFRRALELIEKDSKSPSPRYACFIVEDHSRAWRSGIEFPRFVDFLSQHGVHFISVLEPHLCTDNPMPNSARRLNTQMAAAASEWYANWISDKMKLVYRDWRASGSQFGRPPLGTQFAKSGKKRVLVPTNETYRIGRRTHTYLDTVRRALQLYTGAKPMGRLALALTLNQLNYKWRDNAGKPRRVKESDIKTLLGQVNRYRGILPDALIDATLRRVQERTRHQANHRDLAAPPPLLWGVLYCAVCGKRWVTHHVRAKNGTVHYYYRHVVGDCPQTGYVADSIIDEQAIAIIGEYIVLSASDKRRALELYQPHEADTAQTRAVLEKKLKRIEEGYIEGIISKDTYIKTRTGIIAQLTALVPDTAPRVRPEEMLRLLDSLPALFRGRANPFLKNRAIRDIFERIELRDRRIVRFRFIPELEKILRLRQ